MAHKVCAEALDGDACPWRGKASGREGDKLDLNIDGICIARVLRGQKGRRKRVLQVQPFGVHFTISAGSLYHLHYYLLNIYFQSNCLFFT